MNTPVKRVVSIAMMLICFSSAMTLHAGDRPNFVFMIADDCTYFDIGCYGGQAITPNIDNLATQGMRFTQCFQAAPMCSPTRHNIYTGIYPVKSGAYPNHTFAEDGTKSVVHYLSKLGYRVALSGKRHIAPQAVFPFEYLGKGNNPDFAKVDGFIADCRKGGAPFCLFLCSNEPHKPWNKGDPSQYEASALTLPPNFVDTPTTRSEMTKYLAEISYFDGQVGEALALLDKHKIAENTLFMMISEQGSQLPFAKWTCYDAGIQSAMIVRWPGRVKAGAVSDALVEYVDVLPTFVDAAGGEPAGVLDGRSFMPVLLGKTDDHKEYVFAEMTTRGISKGSKHYGIRSVRSRDYKYIINFTPEVTFENVCTNTDVFLSWLEKAETGDDDAKSKTRRYTNRPGEELYRVSDDPFEQRNLAKDPALAEVKATLRKELLAWMKRCGDEGQATELAAFEHQARNRRKGTKGN